MITTNKGTIVYVDQNLQGMATAAKGNNLQVCELIDQNCVKNRHVTKDQVLQR